MTDQPKTLAEALAQLQGRLPVIKRSERATVPTKTGEYTYTYADLANISEAILPVLAELGLSFSCRPTSNAEGKFVLAYELLHISGEMREGEYPIGGGTPQAVGSSITYARRYTLCAITGLAPDEDDDAAAAQAEADSKRGTVQRRPVARPAPRTVGEASDQPTVTRKPSRPPLPNETADPLAAARREMHIALTDLGLNEAQRKEWIIKQVGRDIGSSKELTLAEINTLNEKVDEIKAARDMEPDEG